MTVSGGPRTQIFISYSHNDAVWLERLQTQLKPLEREGKLERWDDTRIGSGEEWHEAIQEALTRAKVAVLLVSDTFLASDFIAETEVPLLLEAAKQEGVTIMPVLISPSLFENTSLAQFRAVNSPKRTLEEMEPGEWKRVLVKLAQDIKAASAPPTLMPRRREGIPFPRHPFFTGREALLATLYDALQTGPVALTGLGGIGKTQTVGEYAYRHRDDYEAILWLLADSQASLIKSCMVLAAQLNLPQQALQEEEEVVAAVRRWLQAHENWLLVLDNADDLKLAKDFLPSQLPGYVLLTSRATTTGILARGLPVEALPLEESMGFLLHRATPWRKNSPLEDEREAVKALSQELGGLPLALNQAGAYMEKTGSSPAQYLELYRKTEGKILRADLGELSGDHPLVTVTFRLAFEKVATTDPAAAELLQLCAFLHPEGIITKNAPELGEVLGLAVANRLVWIKTRTEAYRYALLGYVGHLHPELAPGGTSGAAG